MFKMNGINHTSTEPANLPSGKLLSKYSAGSQGIYVLNSCADKEHFAVVLSNYMTVVYDAHNNQTAEYVHNNVITDIKFSNRDPSLLFTSSVDGKINVWDSRCNAAVQTFLDNSTGVPKPLLCFDYNSDENFICAGTEIIREDSFLLFWDRRSSECLGGYWDSHTDDITQVQFHPSINSCMASASLDGLVNVYDLNQSSEDDALTNTLNAESGVSKLSWVHSDILSCATSLEEYQLWSVNEPSPILSMTRENLSNKLQYNVNRVIDGLKIADSWCLATGSYDGKVHLWSTNDKDLKPMSCLSKGHTDVVRTICCNSHAGVIYTGGEDGYICQWKV